MRPRLTAATSQRVALDGGAAILAVGLLATTAPDPLETANDLVTVVDSARLDPQGGSVGEAGSRGKVLNLGERCSPRAVSAGRFVTRPICCTDPAYV